MSYIVTTNQQRVLDTLRAPSRYKSQILHNFATEGETCYGYVLRLDPNEPVLMPAQGKITSIRRVFADWPGLDEQYRSQFVYEASIDLGSDITVVITGLSAVSALRGVVYARGTEIGNPFITDILFSLRINGNPVSPGVNKWMSRQDERWVPGQGGSLRAAPDITERVPAGTGLQKLVNGIRYYYDSWTAGSFSINVDFNGSGNKTGLAASGISASDYWNTFASGAFVYTTDPNACYCITYSGPVCGKIPNVPPATFLKAHNGKKTGVRLVRVAVASADAGSAAYFDPMLSTWIGSSLLAANEFSIEGLPSGNYTLHVYSAGPAVANSSITVTVGAPSTKTVTSIAGAYFLENSNYAKFTFTLASKQSVHLLCAGFLNGLQISRS